MNMKPTSIEAVRGVLGNDELIIFEEERLPGSFRGEMLASFSRFLL